VGEIWIKEAQRLTPSGSPGVMEGGKPRVTWHVTVSPSGRSPAGTQYFDAMARVLRVNQSEPHILYDPVTDRLGQFFPLNVSARALRNDGTRRTNGAGLVNIQIEVVANTSPVFTKYWKPGPNYRALMRAIRSWGVPDVWPAGRLATSYADRVDRSWSSYLKPGHFAHCNVPGNDHWDTGPIDQKAIFAAAPVATATDEEDELMALTVKNPVSGEAWSASRALWSIWTYAYQAAQDAKVARALAEASAKSGKPLTAAEIEDIAAATVAALGKDFDAEITLTPKDGS
jgi:hypothetical protein